MRLDADGPDTTRVSYELVLDLGGRLPQLIANRARRDAPLKTLQRLRRHVPATRGDYAQRVSTWNDELPSLQLNPLPAADWLDPEEVDDFSTPED